ESTVKNWPKWAQRQLALGLDLQGGVSLLLQVDIDAVRKDRLATLQDDLRRTLRDARIGYTGGLPIRGNSVEIRLREGATPADGLPKIRALSQPLGGLLSGSGQQSLEVNDLGGGIIRVTITEPAFNERIRQSVDQSIQVLVKRVDELGTREASIQRQGAD